MTSQNLSKEGKILNGFLEKYKDCNPLFILRNLDKFSSLGKAFDNIEDFYGKNNIRWNSDFGLWEEVDLQESKVFDIIKKNSEKD